MKPRVVVVTGASAGVGRAVAQEFAKQGCKLLLIARGKQRLLEAKEEVRKLGGQAWIFPADVAEAEQMEAAAEFAEKTIGPIDVWINNAMVSVFSRVMDMQPEEYQRVTAVTYLGQVYGTLAALRRMKPRNRGKIILVGSALAYRGIPLQSAYCASKHALQGFFESLRAELIHDEVDVSLSIIQLPAMNTPQFSWVKSRLAFKPRPMGTIFQPEVAAREIVRLSTSRDRERIVGFSTAKAILGNKVVPGYLDHYMADHGIDGQLTNEREDPNRENNLWEPTSTEQGAHGTFGKDARNYSWYNWIQHRKPLLAFIGGMLTSFFLVKQAVENHRGS